MFDLHTTTSNLTHIHRHTHLSPITSYLTPMAIVHRPSSPSPIPLLLLPCSIRATFLIQRALSPSRVRGYPDTHICAANIVAILVAPAGSPASLLPPPKKKYSSTNLSDTVVLRNILLGVPLFLLLWTPIHIVGNSILRQTRGYRIYLSSKLSSLEYHHLHETLVLVLVLVLVPVPVPVSVAVPPFHYQPNN
ncbi:hypothetical protein ACMFMF_006267 [Clarireedia jacksonii]